MEKRTLLAVVISLVILLLWDIYFIKPNAPKEPPKQQPKVSAPAPAGPQAPAPAVQVPTQTQPVPAVAQAQTVAVDTPLYKAVWSTEGGALTSFHLKKYRQELDQKSKTVNVIETPMPVFGFNNKFTDETTPYQASTSAEQVAPGIPREVIFTAQVGQGITLRKIYSINPKTYTLGFKMVVENHTAAPFSVNMQQFMDERYPKDAELESYVFEGPVMLVDKHLEEFKLKKVENVGAMREFPGTARWLGYEDKYFLKALIPTASVTGSPTVVRRISNDIVRIAYDSGTAKIDPGMGATREYLLFAGPKELETLKAVGYDLRKALDFGFFDLIAKPMLVAMNWIYGFVLSYGLTIIILTIIIKILLYPLTLKSFKSMKELQKIQPLMKELQVKYKEDKQKLNQEMMKLYSEHKINPMGGCLPMLLQIPILFALYRVFYSAIELRHTPFHIFGTWLPDLSAKDPYYITPILMGLSQFVLQKMSPAPGDEMQQKMMLIMPVIFTVLFVNFPSGLVIYWLVSNILSIIQQAYINRKHT